MLDFNATVNGPQVDVTWSTGSETDNDHFTLERSKDGSQWETVEIFQGAGTIGTVSYYSMSDHRPISGASYYRLIQTDTNGDFDYSPVVQVFMDDGITFNVYPNPAQSFTSVESKHIEGMDITLVNNLGQQIPISITKVEGAAWLALNNLPKGNYFVTMSQGTFSRTEQLLVD